MKIAQFILAAVVILAVAALSHQQARGAGTGSAAASGAHVDCSKLPAVDVGRAKVRARYAASNADQATAMKDLAKIVDDLGAPAVACGLQYVIVGYQDGARRQPGPAAAEMARRASVAQAFFSQRGFSVDVPWTPTGS